MGGVVPAGLMQDGHLQTSAGGERGVSDRDPDGNDKSATTK